MATESVNLSAVPFLDKLNSSAWQSFVNAYEAYKAKDGRKEASQLVSASVLRVVCLRLKLTTEEASKLTSNTFIESVSALFSPKTALESFDRFQKITMNCKNPSVDAVLTYVLAYDKQETLCKGNLPDDKKLKKLFIKNLKPQRLSDRVDFRSPADLAEAKLFAVDEVETLLQMVKEISLASGDDSSSSGPSSSSTTPQKHKKQENAPKSAGSHAASTEKSGDSAEGNNERKITCFGCGEVGHKRPDCPKKASGGSGSASPRWQRDSSGRLTKSESTGAQPLKTVRESADAGMKTPHYMVELGADGVSIPILALWDTGSCASFISTSVYEQLLESGVKVRHHRQEFIVAGGARLQSDLEVTCTLKVFSGVLSYCTEDC